MDYVDSILEPRGTRGIQDHALLDALRTRGRLGDRRRGLGGRRHRRSQLRPVRPARRRDYCARRRGQFPSAWYRRWTTEIAVTDRRIVIETRLHSSPHGRNEYAEGRKRRRRPDAARPDIRLRHGHHSRRREHVREPEDDRLAAQTAYKISRDSGPALARRLQLPCEHSPDRSLSSERRRWPS